MLGVSIWIGVGVQGVHWLAVIQKNAIIISRLFFGYQKMKKVLCALCVLSLVACQPAPTKSSPSEVSMQNTATTHSVPSDESHLTVSEPVPAQLSVDNISKLDLSQLATGTPKADPQTYAYPFDINSEAVKNYAKAYGLSPEQAVHAMTILMASPEALNKILDQIGSEYRTHTLTDGKDAALVVYTSERIAPISFEYVIADNFGKGLVLPVQVLPKKPTSKPTS